MIHSILNSFGWHNDDDNLDSMIRDYVEAQPPLMLDACFCSSRTCKLCQSVLKPTTPSLDSFFSRSQKIACSSDSSCEVESLESMGTDHSTSQSEFNEKDLDFQDSWMLRKWIRELHDIGAT